MVLMKVLCWPEYLQLLAFLQDEVPSEASSRLTRGSLLIALLSQRQQSLTASAGAWGVNVYTGTDRNTVHGLLWQKRQAIQCWGNYKQIVVVSKLSLTTQADFGGLYLQYLSVNHLRSVSGISS